jgi:hypothetical protein
MCKLGKSFGREDNEIRSSTIAIKNIEVDILKPVALLKSHITVTRRGRKDLMRYSAAYVEI